MRIRLALAVALAALPIHLPAAPGGFDALPAALAKLERINGGRLGVVVLNSATGDHAGYRADERFPMCSTFKFLLVSAVLQRVDRQQETLGRTVFVPKQPLVHNSPLTEEHAGKSMTVGALCQAALIRSDNTAANLLLASIGGPSGMTGFSRSIGDQVTRLDRIEPYLNETRPGDPRDTTSPAAMAADLRSVLLSDILTPGSRAQLTAWMESCVTGLDRVRATLPTGWRAADKTGSNGDDTSNDIAVLWPGGDPAIVVTAYLTQCAGPESKRAAVLAEVGRLVRDSRP